ncbi:MAG: HDOD domain-containing protein [Planctomycetota bacterium]|nr:MAG: HDOD domain-containing protein [Planctomycetota bacterium]
MEQKITDEKRPRILVVDDEAVIRSFISRVLEKEGYEVNTAASLKQTLEITSQWAFDLLITDVYLGHATGIDVIRQLQQNAGRGFPVIVMTGFATEQALEEARTLGVHKILLKPLDITTLISTVKKAWKDFGGPGSDSHTQHEKCAGRGGRERSRGSSAPSKGSPERVSIQAVLQSSQKLPRKPALKEHAHSNAAMAHSSPPQRPSHAFHDNTPLDSGVLSAHQANTTILSALQFKHVFKELDEVFSEDNYSRVIAWFAAHPDFTSTLLRFAGSSIFSEASAHSTIELLIRNRGISWAKDMVYALTLFDITKSMYGMKLLNYGKTMRHCLTTAAVAFILASRGENTDPEQATMAGLVHDIGKVLLASLHSRAYQRAQVESATSILSSEMETRHLGISHSTIMGSLAELWEFPDYLISPVTRHHCGWVELMNGNNAQDRMALCIKAADKIAAGVEKMDPPEEWLGRIPAGVLNVLGIDSLSLEKGFKYLPAILQNLFNILPVKQEEIRPQAC